MSDNRLKLNTKKSLYSPIEIEIDDEVYQSIPMTHDVRVRMGEISGNITIMSAEKKSVEALCTFVKYVFNVEQKVLNKLELREIEDIYLHVSKRFSEIEKERLDLIKNTIEKTWRFKGGKEAKKKIPKNRKRSGDKA